MIWRQIVGKSHPEPVVTQFADAYTRHETPMN